MGGRARSRQLAGISLALSLAMTWLWAPGSASGSGSSLAGFVGFSSHMFWMGEADARAEFAPLVANGVTWVREDFRWDVLEPARGVFDWRRSDAVMAAAATTGIDVLPIIDYSAKWASSDPSGAGDIFFPPKSNADYAAFARAVVRRYASNGTFWTSRPDLTPRPITAVELWNEPWGHWFWKSGVDPAAYARLARAGAEAVKAVDPAVKVLIAGDLLQVRSDGAIVAWLDNVLAADPGLTTLVDAYSVHPYPYPRQQGPLVDHTDRRWDYSRITLIRDVTVRRSAVKPIWITELGWSTASTTDSVTEQTQAQFLRDAITRARAEWPYVEKVFAYRWTKDGPGTDRESRYGVRRVDGSSKPAWDALRSLIAVSGVTTTTRAPTTTTAPRSELVQRVVLSARTTKVKNGTRVDLAWSGASGAKVVVKRDGRAVSTTANDGAFAQVLSRKASGTRAYVVCETTGSLACSPAVAVVVA